MSYFAHETAVIDEGCVIGDGTKIWHFSHLMPGCELGERCNLGQNVVVSPDVKLATMSRCRITYLSTQEWFARMMCS